jgi:hypothetical protein
VIGSRNLVWGLVDDWANTAEFPAVHPRRIDMNNDDNTQNRQPKDTMRRFALRTVDVTTRQAAEHPAIAAIAVTVVPVAERVIADQDAVTTQKVVYQHVLKRRDAKVAELHGHVQAWAALVGLDLGGLEGELTARADAPADVIADGERLRDVVQTHAADPRVPYAPQVIEQLDAGLEAAKGVTLETQAERVRLQDLQAKARESAAKLQAELVALRAVLRVTIGSRHFDYQQLRAHRSERVEAEPVVEEGAHAASGTQPTQGAPAVNGNGAGR